ncbi:MAG: ribosomal subunit interface protein [Fusobacteriia bacterium 4572_132]|nr:MAG: ribosomal subunit interface protein [Fusobacteriia bacterium 4572_132]
MRMIISGRHLEITDAIRSYAEKKVGKVTHYFKNIIEMDVTLSVEHSKTEGDKHTADVLVFANGKKIKATASDSILYAAIDEVADLVEKQVKKYNEKMKDRQHHQPNLKEMAAKVNIPEKFEGHIIKSKLISPKPMGVEEAILQMEALNELFYVYMNHETGAMNVVYKRKENSYVHMEPAWTK